ncbi:kinase-like domain-containing protein [Sporodiniella umbellata]|nr:kinase-like domain-containing protein [Sporodiniella umbellata]
METTLQNSSGNKRRASESEASGTLALISGHQFIRIPTPLPYLPSDYLPTPESPRRNLVLTKRQRSLSTGPYLTIQPAEEPSQNHFELVPYREWTVISQNSARGQMVLYNPDNQSITVQSFSPEQERRSSSPSSNRTVRLLFEECPYCHRPLKENNQAPEYMDQNYFRLLASSGNEARSSIRSNETDALDPSMNLNKSAFNQGYYAKFFVELKKLGKGFRGSVFLCEHMLDGVKLGKYAVKKVAIGDNHSWLVKMLREVHLLERLRHPNVVTYKHSWLELCQLSPFGPNVPCLFILMECANGGNLEEYFEPRVTPVPASSSPTVESKRERIKRQMREQDAFEQPIEGKRLLTMTEIGSLFLDIVQGLAHLHQQNIVHRDLKPPNLLLQPRVLISDFGECEDLEHELPTDNRTGATGTLEFMAPEHVLLDARGRNIVDYSPKADMWSLGMVLYFLCYSRLPYSTIDDVDVLRQEILDLKEIHFPKSRLDIYRKENRLYLDALKHPEISADIPNELKLLMRLLLSVDPAKRPSCNEILVKIRERTMFGWPERATRVEEPELKRPVEVKRETVRKRRKSSEQTPSPSGLLMGLPNQGQSHWTVTETPYANTIKSITAVLKVASCTYACSPYTTAPAILYTVLFLATMDFWHKSSSPSFLLLLLHILLLLITTLTTSEPVSTLADFIAGSLGGMANVLVGQPLDTIKVRLQLDTGKSRIGAVNALLFAANSAFKQQLSTGDELGYAKIALAGAGAGAVNSVLASPVELLKVKLQAQATTFRGPIDCATEVVRQEGYRGLLRGLWATVVREIPAYAGFYTGFEVVKRHYSQDDHQPNVLELMTAGAVGGIGYWLCCYPLDVVKSMVQNQPEPPQGFYIIPTLKKIYTKDGLQGLFRGFTPTVIRR